MDGSIYYDGIGDSDSPLLAPLSPNFDLYLSRGVIDDSPYFPGDTYTIGTPRGSLDQRESSSFTLNFLPTGDTIPRPYHGTIDPSAVNTSPNRIRDMSSTSPALYPDRDNSEEVRLQTQQYGNSFNGYSNDPGILPSTQDADGAYGDASRGPLGKKSSTSGNKKRKPSSAKDKDEKASRPATRLRTASRAPKQYSQTTAPRSAEPVEEVKARAAHNQVELQYRKRLNQQFERLLVVLPQLNCDEEGDDAEMADGCNSVKEPMDKRISKAEVLSLARRRIRVLEKEIATLEKQNKELAASEVRFQDEWTRGPGGGVPVKSEGIREFEGD